MTKHLNVIQGDTCFAAVQRFGVRCERKKCTSWFPNESTLNCSVIGAQQSPWTLQEVGESYGLTRMRICQIEKKILKKIKDNC